jgi:hypothetical protein
MPSGEEEREDPPTEPGDDDAREASSSESRGAARLPFLLPWYVFGIFSLCRGISRERMAERYVVRSSQGDSPLPEENVGNVENVKSIESVERRSPQIALK